MPNPNPSIHNYLNESILFNTGLYEPTETIEVPHGVDTTIEFAHIDPFPTDLNFSGDFAIHTWIRTEQRCSEQTRILQTPARGTQGVTNAFSLGVGSVAYVGGTTGAALLQSSRIRFGIDPGTQDIKTTMMPLLPPREWHHVVAQVVIGEPNFIEIYIDGQKAELYDAIDIDYSANTNTGGTDPTGFVVGWDSALISPFIGNMASLAIFNRSLTTEEIAILAQGTINLTGVSQNLKSSLVSWWQMGDKDSTGLTTINDSIGTNHFTTVNISESNRTTDNPPEVPRKHNHRHNNSRADTLLIDPGGTINPVIWDKFAIQNDPSVIPHGWFGAKHVTDNWEYFETVSQNINYLEFNKDDNQSVMFLTNSSANVNDDGIGRLITIDTPNIDTQEHCIEFLSRLHANNGITYVGAVHNPHTFAFNTAPDGVYIRFTASTQAVDLVFNGSTMDVTSGGVLEFSSDFYRYKLGIMNFRRRLTSTTTEDAVRANVYVNNKLVATKILAQSDTSISDRRLSLFMGTYQSTSTPYTFAMGWILYTHVNGGAEDLIGG